jgi:hypothetical protein
MIKKTEFKLNLAGLNELMKSAEMQQVLDEKGKEVASRAGEGYGYRTHVASFVAITNVFPDTKEAAKDNYTNNTLLKAING